MLISSLRITKSTLGVSWLLATLGLLGVALMPHVVSALGGEMFIVRGASMQPTLPLGAVIIVEPVDPTVIVPGDLISFQAHNGPIVTHRVSSVIGSDQTAGVASFVTKGDANTSVDSDSVPPSAVIGRVQFVIPALGVVLTVLTSTVGLLGSLGLLVGLLIAIKFIDDLLAVLRRVPEPGAATAEPAH